jgi:hypothetical protein
MHQVLTPSESWHGGRVSFSLNKLSFSPQRRAADHPLDRFDRTLPPKGAVGGIESISSVLNGPAPTRTQVAMDMDTPMPMPPVEQDAIVQRGAGFNRRVSRPLPRLDDDGQGLGF